MLLKNKTVVLGITGGIAAYKMPNVAHALVKLGADVHVLMTKNATEFISPLVFETLTRRRCQVDTFDRNFQYDVAHISLANAADLMLIAPATANVIAKLAHGQADDMLTTVTLAATCPKLVAPAMNTHMLENPITQDNLKTLEHYGFTVIPSGSGMLACGDVGSGRLPDEGVLVDYALRELACAKDLKGKKVAVKNGTMSNQYAESIKDQYGFEVVTVSTSPDMYQAVIGGQVQACFDDTPILKYSIKTGELDMKYIDGTENDSAKYGFAIFNSNNQDLIDSFNKGLKNIKESGEYDKIIAKYLG